MYSILLVLCLYNGWAPSMICDFPHTCWRLCQSTCLTVRVCQQCAILRAWLAVVSGGLPFLVGQASSLVRPQHAQHWIEVLHWQGRSSLRNNASSPNEGSLPSAVAIAVTNGRSSCIPGTNELENANLAMVPTPAVHNASVIVVGSPSAPHLALKLGSESVRAMAQSQVLESKVQTNALVWCSTKRTAFKLGEMAPPWSRFKLCLIWTSFSLHPFAGLGSNKALESTSKVEHPPPTKCLLSQVHAKYRVTTCDNIN